MIEIEIRPGGNYSCDRSHPQPEKIAEYFVNAREDIIPGRENARYLRKVESGSEVNMHIMDEKGLAGFVNKDGKDHALDVLLKWAQQNSEGGQLTAKKVFADADFVSWRGVLARIGATPYLRTTGWKLVAVRAGDVIYLNERDPPGKDWESGTNPEETYTGFRFEQLMTTAKPAHENNEEEDAKEANEDSAIDCNEQYITVVKNDFPLEASGESLRVVSCAEVDAIDEDGNFVELKITNPIKTKQKDGQTEHEHAEEIAENKRKHEELKPADPKRLGTKFWRNKSLKTFLQCRTCGVQTLVVGLKEDVDQDDVVTRVMSLKIDDLEGLNGTENGISGWKGDVALNFISDVLQRIQMYLSADNHRCTVWYEPPPFGDLKNRRYCIRIKSETINDKTIQDDSNFLSPHFLKHFKLNDSVSMSRAHSVSDKRMSPPRPRSRWVGGLSCPKEPEPRNSLPPILIPLDL